MTREQVEKGIQRMYEFFEEIDEPCPMDIHDEIYREAFIRTLMEYDSLESFDYETRKWFIEDETEYQKAKNQAKKEYYAIGKFHERLAEHYDDIEEEEETNETSMESC